MTNLTLFGMVEVDVIEYMGDLGASVRVEWASEVLGKCQHAVGTLMVFNRGAFHATFERLAWTLPLPESPAERIFLIDRMRTFSRTAALRFHATFHEVTGEGPCAGAAVDASDAIWNNFGAAASASQLLQEWLRHFVTTFEAEHRWPTVWILAERLGAVPANVPDLTLLAREMGLSRSSLTRRFKQTFGVSIQMFQTIARLRLAADLLRQTSLSIEEVATMVGYESPSNLYGAFKRFIGLTPREVRHGDPDLLYARFLVGSHLLRRPASSLSVGLTTGTRLPQGRRDRGA
jgi:AraC-like DNA-binding protein